jgi:hypothetical protein
VHVVFVIGSVIGFALAERNARRAVLVGIAAPAIITNVNQGVSEGQESKKPVMQESFNEKISGEADRERRFRLSNADFANHGFRLIQQTNQEINQWRQWEDSRNKERYEAFE